MFFKKRSSNNNPQDRLRRTSQIPRASVYSYHASRSLRPDGTVGQREDQQAKPAPRRSLAWLQKMQRLRYMGVALGAFLILLLCLYLGSEPRIVPMGDAKSAVFLRNQSVYQAAAKEEFSRSVLNRNKLTVHTKSVAQNLQRQFPELRAVSVSLPLVGDRPIVYIQPSQPKLILAGSQAGTFVLDSSGRALISGNQVQHLEKLQLPVVNDQSNLKLAVGDIALPSRTVAFITEVVGQLKVQNIQITSITLPPGGNEMRLQVSGASYYVKFNLYGNAREEAGSYLAVRKYLVAHKKTPREYVDVRVENRAYYK